MELIGKLKSIFSVYGVYNRLQYLLYGIVIPMVIGLVAYFVPTSSAVMVIIALYLMIIAIVKRARDTRYNTTTLTVLCFIPYVGLIAQLFLFFAPHGDKNINGSGKLVTILVVVFVIVILGILTAVAIPKLQKTRHNAEIAKEQVQIQQ
jgi:K+-sensing histidine kinase KdpD